MMSEASLRAALERIAGTKDCPKAIYNIAADALCWARKFDAAHDLPALSVDSVSNVEKPWECAPCISAGIDTCSHTKEDEDEMPAVVSVPVKIESPPEVQRRVAERVAAAVARTSEATPALVRCWRCKHDVPEETTVCNAGIGTQCKDARACRGRWYGPAADYLDIVFGGGPSHESGRFVKVEDPSGKSVRVGEWIDRGDGYWALRIPQQRPTSDYAIRIDEIERRWASAIDLSAQQRNAIETVLCEVRQVFGAWTGQATPGATVRVFCACGHEDAYHSKNSGRCLLQNADDSECACTAFAPGNVYVGDVVYRLVPAERSDYPRPMRSLFLNERMILVERDSISVAALKHLVGNMDHHEVFLERIGQPDEPTGMSFLVDLKTGTPPRLYSCPPARFGGKPRSDYPRIEAANERARLANQEAGRLVAELEVLRHDVADAVGRWRNGGAAGDSLVAMTSALARADQEVPRPETALSPSTMNTKERGSE